MPAMIIMTAANRMNPTAQPLASSPARADLYPDDSEASVIC
jgi:hypothetical protein